MRRGIWVGSVAVGICLALPAASAAETFSGQSAQGKLVRLSTQPNGEVRGFGIRWSTQDCNPEGGRLAPRWTGFGKPLDRSRPGFFADKGQYEVQYTDAKVRFVGKVEGRRRSDDRWSGTFKIKAFIDPESGPDFTCKRRRTSWRAKSS